MVKVTQQGLKGIRPTPVKVFVMITAKCKSTGIAVDGRTQRLLNLFHPSSLAKGRLIIRVKAASQEMFEHIMSMSALRTR